MPNGPNRQSTAVRSYLTAIKGQVIALAQAQVAHHASQNNNFLEAFEGGAADYAIYIGDDTLEGDATDKFFALRRFHQRLFVGLDNKVVTLRSDHRGNLFWSSKISAEQYKSVEALIISSTQEPAFVAVIPMAYIRRAVGKASINQGEQVKIVWEYYRPLWALQSFPAFPSSMAPFMLPIIQLPGAIEAIRKYAKGLASAWVNDYTAAQFDPTIRLSYQNISILEPSYPGWRTAMEMVEVLYRAFKRHSTNFQVKCLDLHPILGDFKFIRNNSTNTEVMMEAKYLHCDITFAGERLTSMTHLQMALGFNIRRPIFCWKANWDYMYSVPEKGRFGLFLPRDEIPSFFWNSPEREVSWPLSRIDDLKPFLIHLKPAERLVEDIERILLTRERAHFLKAQNCIPISPYRPITLAEVIAPDQDDFEEEMPNNGVVDTVPTSANPGWYTQDFRRGFGSSDHCEMRGDTYEAWAAGALTEICRKWGRGLVLDLGGTGTAARFYLVRYTWSPAEKVRSDNRGETPRAFHVQKGTPRVPPTFIKLDFTHGHSPRFGHTIDFATTHRLAERSNTIVIVDIFPMNNIRSSHGRFVLPQSELPATMKRFLATRPQHCIWDGYFTNEKELVNTILKVADGSIQTSFGPDRFPTVVQNNDYCQFLSESFGQNLEKWVQKLEARVERKRALD
ncbi:MAG: hypothetical protein Q9213_005469 [Squamulea squamosa]